MTKIGVIRWARKLQGISKAELSTLAGLSLGAISKFDSREAVLSEENIKTVLDVLQIKLEGDKFKFSKGAFIKVLIQEGENFWKFPDYEPLFELLELYKGSEMKVYMVEAENKNLIDKKIHRNFRKEIPPNYIVIDIGDGDLSVFVGRKKEYLLFPNILKEQFRSYGCAIHSVVDKNIKFKEANRALINAFLRRHD